jgi:hypothetical protein
MMRCCMWLAWIGFAACHTPAPVSPEPFPDEVLPDEAARREACSKAGANLEALKCREARPDFVDFCMYQLRESLPFRPVCLGRVKACAEVESCRS